MKQMDSLLSPSKKEARFKKSYFLIFISIILMGGWFYYGSFVRKKSPIPVVMPSKTKVAETLPTPVLQKVRVQNFIAEVYPVYVHLSGVTAPFQSAEISSQMNGVIKKIYTPKGKWVTRDVPLISLDPQDYLQKKTVAESLLHLKKMQFEAASKLGKKDYRSPISVAKAAAEYEQAKQAFKKAQLDCESLTIRAPFDGVVESYQVEEGSDIFTVSGAPVAKFVNLHPLIVKVFVNEQTFHNIALGQKALVTLANQKVVEGGVCFLSVVGDNVTKTFKVEISIPNIDHGIPAGMTATVKLEIKDQRLHKISPACLVLSEEGALGVKVVEGTQAKFLPVKIVDSTDTYVLVAGLPDSSDIIMLGQETVRDGETVMAIFTDTVASGMHD